jgi:hypothetical protein
MVKLTYMTTLQMAVLKEVVNGSSNQHLEYEQR